MIGQFVSIEGGTGSGRLPEQWTPESGFPRCRCLAVPNASIAVVRQTNLTTNIQLMTIPACSPCNRSFQMDELRAAAIICAVSFTDYDRAAVAEGGWLHAAMQRDRRLRDFIDNRLQR